MACGRNHAHGCFSVRSVWSSARATPVAACWGDAGQFKVGEVPTVVVPSDQNLPWAVRPQVASLCGQRRAGNGHLGRFRDRRHARHSACPEPELGSFISGTTLMLAGSPFRFSADYLILCHSRGITIFKLLNWRMPLPLRSTDVLG